MTSNYLPLSPSKTEFLLIGLPQKPSKIVNPSLFLPSIQPIMPSLSAKNLGFRFASRLSFSKQISSLASTCHYHIRDLRNLGVLRFELCPEKYSKDWLSLKMLVLFNYNEIA